MDTQGRDQSIQIFLPQTRTGGIMHQDPVLGGCKLREIAQGGHYRMAALLSSEDNPQFVGTLERQFMPIPITPGDGDYHALDPGMLTEPFKRMFNNCLASQAQVLFGE